MEEIIEALENNYRSEWTCENKDEKARLEFLNSFLSQIDITDYNSILKMNKQDFLLAYLSTNKENIESFSSLHEKVKSFSI